MLLPKKLFDILFCIVLTNVMVACAHSNEFSKPTLTSPTLTEPALSTEVNHIPVTGTDTSQKENHPVIDGIQFPETVQRNSMNSIGEVHFSDEDGDIYSAQFTCIDCGCMDFEYFAFNPTTALSSGDRFGGIFQFQQSCINCPENQSYAIIMQIQLFDLNGNASVPENYTFICSD